MVENERDKSVRLQALAIRFGLPPLHFLSLVKKMAAGKKAPKFALKKSHFIALQ